MTVQVIYTTTGATTLTTASNYTDSGAKWEALGAGSNGIVGTNPGGGNGGSGGEYRRRDTPGLAASTGYAVNVPLANTGSRATGPQVKDGRSTVFLEAKNANGHSGGTGGTGTTANFNGGAGAASAGFSGGCGGGASGGSIGAGQAGGVNASGAQGAGGGGSNGGSSSAGASGSAGNG